MPTLAAGRTGHYERKLLMTVFNHTYDTDTPVGTDAPSVIDDRIREVKDAVQERADVDHYWKKTGSQVSDTAVGQHRQIEFYEPISTPTHAANKVFIYSKDVGGKAEVHILDEDGNEIQVTNAGELKIIPPGLINPFAGSSAPAGWLLCNGAAVSRTTYADLFGEIGTTFGVGNGTTTFNLPDLVGRVPVGTDSSGTRISANNDLAESDGSEDHTLTTAEMPAHTHIYTYHTGGAVMGLEQGTDHGVAPQNTGSAGGGGAHNNLQPYLVLNYIIKT